MSVTEASAPPTAAGSFYVTGGTLPFDAASYVPRQADHDLLAGLTQGEFCYVLNTRQMGKSSLMIRTAHHLRDAGETVAVLDLTAVGQNLSPEQWYDGLLMSLAEQLHLEDALEDFWGDNPGLGPLQRFITAIGKVVLPRIPRRLVLFVDEIDAVRSLPFPADEFFAAIRECYNRRRVDPLYEKLAFCLLGVATPADLIQDTRLSPFNIGRRILLTDFTPAEAAPLARGIGGGAAVLGRVLYWTNGHPYMTQRLCRAIAEEPEGVTAGQVDALCERLFLTKQARDTDDNLAFVRNRLLRSEVDLAALLDLYQQVRAGKKVKDDETNPLVPVLRLSGVVNAPEGLLRVRNRIYDRVFDKDWVRAHMPDAELRRQREAYRRGLVRAGVVAAAVLLVMGLLAASAVHQTRIANENAAQRAAALTDANRQKKIAQAQTQYAQAQTQYAQQQAGVAAQQSQAARRAEGETKKALSIAKQNAIQNSQRAVALAGANRQKQTALTDAKRQRQIALNSLADAKAQARRADAQTQKAKTAGVQEHAEKARAEHNLSVANRNLYTADMNLIHQEWESANVGHVINLLQETKNSTGRGFEWGYWNRLCHLDLRTLRGHMGAVLSASFSPDGRRIVTGSNDGTAKVWDAQSGRETLTLRGHTGQVSSASFSPDGARIVTGSSDRTAKVWDAQTGQETLTLRGHALTVLAVAFSPDGAHIVTGSYDGTAKVWDAQTGRETLTFRGPTAAVRSAQTTQEPSTLIGPTASVYSVAFSPDGAHIVAGCNGGSRDNTVKVWDAQTGRETLTLMGHTSSVSSVAFSPDGARIVTGSWDHTAKVWDAQTGRELLTLTGHTGFVFSAVFSPDGSRIVTNSSDGTAKVWFSDMTPMPEDDKQAPPPATGNDSIHTLMPIRSSAGVLRLAAADAVTHGAVRYEPGLDDLGYWESPDWVGWPVQITQPGKFHVEAQLAALGISTFTITAGGQVVRGSAQDTGDWTKYQKCDLGTLAIRRAGLVWVSVHPVADGWKGMNLKSLTLTPVPERKKP